MDVFVNGQKTSLNQKDFVAKGGEGSIYKKGTTAYKIYEDLKKMIPVAKIKELSVLNKPEIIVPKDVVYSEKKYEVGFTMDWIGADNYVLCKLFTNSFRDANLISNDMVIQLVDNIKNITHYIHQNKCLIVDGNEFNYLVAKDFTTPYFIDVNSWQTPNFPATAIMPSVRDWTTNVFNEGTDWFSFAIISFQLFTGIHPYKGKHISYKMNDFRKRIIDHISVFNPQVSLPPTVRDFNLIPSSYKDWFFHVFENGKRTPPPDLPGAVGQAQVIVTVIQSTDNFEIREIKEYDSTILYHNPSLTLTKTKNKIWINKVDYKVTKGTELIFTQLENIPIMVKIENNKVLFKCLNSSYDSPNIDLECTDMMIVNNILFLKNEEKLMEMSFQVFKISGKDIIKPIIKKVWSVEPNSSQIFTNVILQSVLGKTFMCIPLPHFDKSNFIIKPIPQLDNYRIVDAKYDNKVCMLIGYNAGLYTSIKIVFDENYDKYSYTEKQNVDFVPVNFVTLDNGVCISITHDDAIEIFLNKINKPDVKRIEDPIINSTMRLVKDGVTLKFFKDKKLFEMKMKGSK